MGLFLRFQSIPTPGVTRADLARLHAAAKASAAERERCARIVERWNDRPTHDWSFAVIALLLPLLRLITHDRISFNDREHGPSTSHPDDR
jgi:hypothetical protein